MKSFSRIWLSISIVVIVLGIGLLVVNVINGFTIGDIPTYSEDLSFARKDIEDVNIDIDYGDVSITEGDEFHIKGENLPKDSLEVFIDEEGTWIIHQNSDYLVDVFGIDVSLGNITWWEQDLNQRIEITIPKDFIASEFNFQFGAGSARIDNVRAKSGQFDIGAGELEIDYINLEEKSDFNVGTGKMTINEMNVNNTTVDCGIGNIIVKGTITGNNKISCGIGEVQMDLTGNIENYTIDIDKGIGNININGESYSSMRRIINRSKLTDNRINLDCGIGRIIINME